MKIIFIRHGITYQNEQMLVQGRQNNPLSSVGILQAKKVALLIKEDFNNIDLFFSSPLKRAYDTARYISTLYSKKVKKVRAFLERDFGVYENKSVLSVNYSEKPIKGRFETNEKLEKRVVKHIDMLAKKYNGKTILIVAHSHTIKSFLSNRLGISYKEKIKNCEYIYLDYENKIATIIKRRTIDEE